MSSINGEVNGVSVYRNRGFSPGYRDSEHQQRHRRHHQQHQRLVYPDSDGCSSRSSACHRNGHRSDTVYDRNRDSDDVSSARNSRSSSRNGRDNRQYAERHSRRRDSPSQNGFSDNGRETPGSGSVRNGRGLHSNRLKDKREITTKAIVEPVPPKMLVTSPPSNNGIRSPGIEHDPRLSTVWTPVCDTNDSEYQSYFGDALNSFDLRDDDMFATINNVSAFVSNGGQGKVIDMAKFNGNGNTGDEEKDKQHTDWPGVMTDLFYNLDNIDLGKYFV